MDQQNPKRSFYLYNRNYTVKTHQIIEDEDLVEENPEEFSNLIILPYNNKKIKGASTTSIIHHNSFKKVSDDINSPQTNAVKTSIVIHKSDMKLYSNKVLCIKNHIDSVCSINPQSPNFDINITKYENDELISNYTNEDDIESNCSNYLNSKKHRNTKSFHDNSKIIHEFNSNFERDDLPHFKNDRINIYNQDRQNLFYKNSRKSLKKYTGFCDDTALNSTFKVVNSHLVCEEDKKDTIGINENTKNSDKNQSEYDQYEFKNLEINKDILNQNENGNSLNYDIILF